MPTVSLRVKEKISAKQKIGKGVVHFWWGGEFGIFTHDPILIYVSL